VNTPGSAVTVSMEGTRPILVEVQGLTSPTSLGIPRRTPIGVDLNRLHLITAVLTRRLGMRLADQDVFVNVIGGLRVSEPAADLAIAAALASSMRDNALPADMVFIGEVGLSGELRSVGHMAGRLKEAQRLGFCRAVIARGARQGEAFPLGISVLSCRSLREAFGQLFTREAKAADSA
jgi:DNA repair protein RadA/Sms